MIQRIQTVYLAMASVLLLVPMIFELTLASISVEGGIYELTPVTAHFTVDGALTEKLFGSFSIAAAFALSLFLTVYGIMQYKNRKFQMRLVQLAMVFQPIIAVVVFIYAQKMVNFAEETSISYSPVLGILLVNMVLYFLAYRGIKKDDELVRSADRLR